MKWVLGIIISSAIILVIVCTRNVLFAEAPTTIKTPQSIDGITVGWVGDMVPSDDATYAQHAFVNVQDALQQPDLMIGNLEGTFASANRTSKCLAPIPTCFAFRGDPAFAEELKNAGFDFVSLVNNHSYDYGKDGLADTEAVLDAAGIPYIAPDKPITNIVIKNKKIGIIGLSFTDGDIGNFPYIQRQVSLLKSQNDFVIVIFHGGAEGADKTAVTGQEEFQGTEDRGNVELMAHTAVDSGADLVLGSGPHVLRKIEYYNNGVIAYSLGNFVGGKHLSMTGNLALSGIFTASLASTHPTATDFTSVILSQDGIPSIDLFGQGKALVETLSK